MVALTLAAVGIYAAVSVFWSLPTAILTGTGAAAGLALGNLGGVAGPSIVGVIRQETGSFTAALLFLAAVVAFGGVIALLFGQAARARAKASGIVPQTGE
jgi:ACS family tartrate transporter-like MFS transporter